MVKFAVFSDLHYKEGMYTASVADLEKILKRAADNNVDFVLCGGDFCNDYKGSPEIVNAFLNNKYGLPVYNVYGNHELESTDNSMEFVTPLLTNDRTVTWGTPNGKYNSDIGYYFFEKNRCKVICLDTNYSWNPELSVWEHNRTKSYGPPKGNFKTNSLGPVQLAWLEKVLTDAAEKGLKCIVLSHDSFSGKFHLTSSDAKAVRDIFNKVNNIKEKTVVLAINGHIHTDNTAVIDGVVYLDVNTVKNGWWKQHDSHHYSDNINDGHTFEFIHHDDSGRPVDRTDRLLCTLSQAKNTWFFDEPLSAVVTLSDNKLTIDGMDTHWLYGVVPTEGHVGTKPTISSGVFEL